MPQSTPIQTQASSPRLRVVRDEDAPPYDGIPSARPRTEAFAMIPDAVFSLNDGTAIAVYAVLAKHAGKEGTCWPSMKRLESLLGWTDNRIRPALRKLVDAGLVEIERRQLHGMDQANVYRLHANVQVSRDRTAVSRSGSMGIPSRVHGYPATGHELEPIELDTKELTNGHLPKSSPKRKTYSEPFEAFWRAYPKDHGTKSLAFIEWNKLDAAERAAAMDALPAFKASRRWKEGYIKDAERYLKHRMWESPPTEAAITSLYGDMPQEIARLAPNNATRLVWEQKRRDGAV